MNAPEQLKTAISVTVIESLQPKFMTKKFSLKPDGTLLKTSIAELTRGRCQRFDVKTLHEFSNLLDGLQPNQAMLYGIAPDHPAANVVTKAALAATPMEMT